MPVQKKKTFNEESYILGNTKTVNQGDIIASELQGEVETKRKWVGIFNSKDGWGPARLKYSDDYVEKKLYYVGFNNSYIHLMYREYRQGEDQPFVNKTKEFDPEIDPFIELGIFKIKVLSAGGLQASFLLFDKQSWSKEKQFYLIAKEKKEKEDELDRIIHATKLLRDESQAAKNYAESFVNITPTFETFSQAAYEFDELSSTFNGVKMNNYSIDQLIEIYQTLENQFSQSAQYFTTVATVLEAWEAMDGEFRKAAQTGIGKDYFTMALDIKNSGDRDLQAEQFTAATQKYLQARQEINRVTAHIQNSN